MSLDGSRLNTARYNSVLADFQIQFPMPPGLQPAEQAALTANQQKMAHAFTDHEGSDVVEEFTVHAEVDVTSVNGVTPGSGSSGPGTGTIT